MSMSLNRHACPQLFRPQRAGSEQSGTRLPHEAVQNKLMAEYAARTSQSFCRYKKVHCDFSAPEMSATEISKQSTHHHFTPAHACRETLCIETVHYPQMRLNVSILVRRELRSTISSFATRMAGLYRLCRHRLLLHMTAEILEDEQRRLRHVTPSTGNRNILACSAKTKTLQTGTRTLPGRKTTWSRDFGCGKC